MLGELVAVRIQNEGTGLLVSGLIAGEKNRKVGWSFETPVGDPSAIAAKVVEMEAARKAKVKE